MVKCTVKIYIFSVLSCAFSMHRPPTRLIKFRNYMPKDDSLKEKKIPNTKPLSGKQVKYCNLLIKDSPY